MGMLAHAWDVSAPKAASASIEPLVWATLSTSGQTAAQLAATAYTAIAAKASDRRTLFLRHLGEQRTGVANLNSRSYLDFMKYGPTATAWANFMVDFWTAFKAQGSARPTRIVVDNEAGYTWYAIPGASTSAARAAAIQSVRDAGFEYRYPAELSAYTQSDLAAFDGMASHAAAPGVVMHDQCVRRYFSDGLREVVVGTYERVFGATCPPCSNYGNVRTHRSWVTEYGFTHTPESDAVGLESAPALYPWINKDRYDAVSNAQGRKSYMAFQGSIERLRACYGRVCPWIGCPGYRDDDANRSTVWAGWRKWVHQLALHGVSEVLYFVGDYSETQGERDYAEETFATATVVRPRAIDRYPVPVVDGSTTLYTGIGEHDLTDFAYSQADWV